jgi:two-component system cell cycle sensor histidine kinase/response regulator CckA
VPVSLRVLLVEDSPADAKLVVYELQELDPAVITERVDEAAAMIEALGRGPWDVILSDWSMPRFGALAALRIAREAAPDVPFLIVSGTVGEEAAADAMRAGARDYVLKDRLSRLRPAIERELRERDERRARRSSEDALRDRLDTLERSGIIGITIADPGGRLLEANDAYLAMIGRTRAELQAGKLVWSDLIPPEHAATTARMAERLTLTGTAPAVEFEVFGPGGRRVPVLAGAAMLDPPHVIAFTVDRSAQQRVEAALRDAESQLRHAQKMEAVGRLAGGIAHDFNNLLSVVLTYSEMLEADLEPGQMRDDIGEIRKAGERAAALTRQLLLFSRQQVLQPVPLDLGATTRGMEKLLQRLLGEDVELVIRTAPSLGTVRADPSSIEQVLMNLAVNSRDAMPQGGTLTIEAENVELDPAFAALHVGAEPGSYVMVAVTDTGVGMDPQTKSRIFEPFFTTKDAGRGTGLGLSTVFGIAQQSDGHIWVYSEPGHGTTFKLYLPRIDAVPVAVGEHAASTEPTGTETILLVEDEDPVRAAAREILQRHGYTVLVARDGIEALAVAEAHPQPIQLLLTDVVMPRLGGPELATRLLPRRPGLRLLCMSGYTDDTVVRHGVLAAEIPYLQKPFTPAGLARRVREVLDAPAT